MYKRTVEKTITPNIHTTKLQLRILDPRSFNFSRVHLYYKPKIWRLSRELFRFPFSLFTAKYLLPLLQKGLA